VVNPAAAPALATVIQRTAPRSAVRRTHACVAELYRVDNILSQIQDTAHSKSPAYWTATASITANR